MKCVNILDNNLVMLKSEDYTNYTINDITFDSLPIKSNKHFNDNACREIVENLLKQNIEYQSYQNHLIIIYKENDKFCLFYNAIKQYENSNIDSVNYNSNNHSLELSINGELQTIHLNHSVITFKENNKIHLYHNGKRLYQDLIINDIKYDDDNYKLELFIDGKWDKIYKFNEIADNMYFPTINEFYKVIYDYEKDYEGIEKYIPLYINFTFETNADKTDVDDTNNPLLYLKKYEKSQIFQENFKKIENGDMVVGFNVMLDSKKYGLPTKLSTLQQLIQEWDKSLICEFNDTNNEYRIYFDKNNVDNRLQFIIEAQKLINIFTRKRGEIVGDFNARLHNCNSIEEVEELSNNIFDFDGNKNYGWSWNEDKQQLDFNISIALKTIDVARYTGDLDKLKELNENDKSNFLNNFLIL